jgi:hypothetical protein
MSNQESKRGRDHQSLRDLARLANARTPEISSPEDDVGQREDSGLIDLSALENASVDVPTSTPPISKDGDTDLSITGQATIYPRHRPPRRFAFYASSALTLVAVAAFLVLPSRGSNAFREYGTPPLTPKPAANVAEPLPTVVAAAPSIVQAEEAPPAQEGAPAEEGIAERKISPPRSVDRGHGQTGKKVAKDRARDDGANAPSTELLKIPGQNAPLGDAMMRAVGAQATRDAAQSEKPATANESTEAVSQAPATGALRAALSAALPGAQACLGPDDPISRVQVVFGSRGAAIAVHVSGGAAGKPAARCIEAAFMRAHVPPFAQSTYAATLTVRP